MTIIGLLVLLILIGVLVWAAVTYVPMPAWMKTIITVVAIIITILIVLRAFGILDFDEPVPQL